MKREPYTKGDVLCYILAAALIIGSVVGFVIAFSWASSAQASSPHWTPIIRLSSVPAQHNPAAPKPHLAKYVCTTGSLGDHLCCVWHITYPGYGFGTWNDCVIVPAERRLR